MKQDFPTDQALLDAFVAAFGVEAYDFDEQENQAPSVHVTKPTALEPLYAILPGHFPPLYEQLVLSYRWPQAALPMLDLLANPPGAGLEKLLEHIQADKGLWDELMPNGYVQFGHGAGGRYDPVCFDTRHRRQDGDCRVVRFDHEEILCNYRIKEVSELADSFRSIVLAAIEASF